MRCHDKVFCRSQEAGACTDSFHVRISKSMRDVLRHVTSHCGCWRNGALQPSCIFFRQSVRQCGHKCLLTWDDFENMTRIQSLKPRGTLKGTRTCSRLRPGSIRIALDQIRATCECNDTTRARLARPQKRPSAKAHELDFETSLHCGPERCDSDKLQPRGMHGPRDKLLPFPYMLLNVHSACMHRCCVAHKW